MYCFLGNRFVIRRVEISRGNSIDVIILWSIQITFKYLKVEESFQYPNNWSHVNDEDYNLIDVLNNSAEYLNVFNDFKAKLGSYPIHSFKVSFIFIFAVD